METSYKRLVEIFVTRGRKMYRVVLFFSGGKIEFRDIRNFNTIVYDYPCAYHEKMHTSRTALWIVSHSFNRKQIEIHRLECSTLPLPDRDVVTKLDERYDVQDMCYVERHGVWNSIVVLACGVGGCSCVQPRIR